MKLTILGGGGFRVPLVYEAVATGATGLTVDEVALHDIDESRLRTITAVIESMGAELQAAGRVGGGADGRAGAGADSRGASLPRLVVTTDLREAVAGSSLAEGDLSRSLGL